MSALYDCVNQSIYVQFNVQFTSGCNKGHTTLTSCSAPSAISSSSLGPSFSDASSLLLAAAARLRHCHAHIASRTRST